MGFLAMGVFWGAWGTLIPAVRATTGASDASLGAALLCVAAGAIPSMIAGGRLVDCLGVRLLVPLSIAMFGASALLPALAPTVIWLAAALFLLGMCSGFMDIVINAGIAEADARSGHASMQFAHGSFAAAYVVVALVSGQARGAEFGPLPILAVVAIVCLCLALLARLWVGEAGTPPAKQSDGYRPSPFLIALGAIGAVAYLTENGLQSWSALFLERLLSAGPELSSIAPATVGLAVAVGRFSGQAVTERLGDRTVIVAGASCAVLGSLFFAVSTSPLMAYAGIFLAAAGVSVITPAALGIAGRRATPVARGSAVATVAVIAYSGFFLGPAILGFLSESYGLRVAMGSLSVGALLTIVIAILIVSPRSKPSAAPPPEA